MVDTHLHDTAWEALLQNIPDSHQQLIKSVLKIDDLMRKSDVAMMVEIVQQLQLPCEEMTELMSKLSIKEHESIQRSDG